ncbi:uncharacterized protein LOC107992196 [Cucumis melo]|uniref:Uncharacterized protein LOC107992196 n=1 Tax=Cucumis melo TaxID=3656 RepID=A0A1S4E5E1_CUCME|nr:uncharacterized protein LOC107992196 [Cucumis melo]XP_050946414.1 uncharacterized protein LOC107992196 [Cucumis melo]XP_050946415.1 uncharacterized protein LOC107992196 [Cucumis melo]XP_050946416.1 uncharacterized protein LOC107992196 [Cucumis melo]XP_050946417.1 uncharacterized protein LOC107992196 [Cucumis melo]
MINYSKAKIKVSQNLCGFLPATVELRDENQGNIFFNFGDFEALEDPKVIEGAMVELRDENQGNIFFNFGDFEALEDPKVNEGAMFLKDFANPIDLMRLNQVLLDEEEDLNTSNSKWRFLLLHFQNLVSKGIPSRPCKKRMIVEGWVSLHLLLIGKIRLSEKKPKKRNKPAVNSAEEVKKLPSMMTEKSMAKSFISPNENSSLNKVDIHDLKFILSVSLKKAAQKASGPIPSNRISSSSMSSSPDHLALPLIALSETNKDYAVKGTSNPFSSHSNSSSAARIRGRLKVKRSSKTAKSSAFFHFFPKAFC